MLPTSACEHLYDCWRPYRAEYTGSLPNSEVNRRRARSVLDWGTVREHLRVLPAFFTRHLTGLVCYHVKVASPQGCMLTVAILAQGKHSG